MIRSLLLSLPLSLLLFSTVNAQQYTGSLSGTVVDQGSESPVPFATVTLPGTEPLIGTTTDANGRFRLDSIPVGRYDVQVSFVGYEPALSKDILISTGRPSALRIGIKEAITALKEVEVRPDENKEQPLNKMAVVSARQLRVEEANKYAGGYDDPARLAASFAGVANDFTNTGIVIRGNAPKGLVWRLEGVDVPAPVHFGEITGFGAGGISAISSQVLDNSDFFTGAFPAEYGNALSGVFDLSMRTGDTEERNHAVQLGFLGLDASSEGPIKKGGNASYLFNYRYSTLGLVDVFLPPGEGVGVNYQDLSYKVVLPTEKAGKFTLWGLGLIDRVTTTVEEDTTLWTYNEDLESDNAGIGSGVAGLSHQLFLSSNTYLKSVVAGSINSLWSELHQLDGARNEQQLNDINFDTRTYQFSTLLNHKFSAFHTNRTGLVVHNLHYNIQMDEAPNIGDALVSRLDDRGNSYLIRAYSQSAWSVGKRLWIMPGFNAQYFVLNRKLSLEPRLAAKWQAAENQFLSLGYGKHSQLEKISFYLMEIGAGNSDNQPNKTLDFTKAHHVVLGYDRMFGDHVHLKVEPYYQWLYDVPVIADSSFSFINLEDDFFVTETLENSGTGENIGVDVTLERFLHRGWYSLFTASVFNSRYRGGDGVWRDTRFNQGIVSNCLIGKEWVVKKKNQFNASTRLTYYGGNRHDPIDRESTLAAGDVIQDASRAFEVQKPAGVFMHLTVTYRVNKARHANLWSLQLLNLTGTPQNYGYRYNFRDSSIAADEESVFLPNLSYKIEF